MSQPDKSALYHTPYPDLTPRRTSRSTESEKSGPSTQTRLQGWICLSAKFKYMVAPWVISQEIDGVGFSRVV
jgi:hypothetical protein